MKQKDLDNLKRNLSLLYGKINDVESTAQRTNGLVRELLEARRWQLPEVNWEAVIHFFLFWLGLGLFLLIMSVVYLGLVDIWGLILE